MQLKVLSYLVKNGGKRVCVADDSTKLRVFQSRLKSRTGRARFKETGKLMQGNERRHQTAHCSLRSSKIQTQRKYGFFAQVTNETCTFDRYVS